MNRFQSNEFRLLRLASWALFGTLILTFVIWGTVIKLSGAVIASGTLEVAGYKQIVQHDKGGVAEEVFVQNGSRVEAGDVLIEIDSQTVKPEFEIYNRLYIEALAEKGRLIAERDNLSAPKYPQALLDLVKTEKAAAAVMADQDSLFKLRREAVQNEASLLEEQESQLNKRVIGRQAERKTLEDQLALSKGELERNRRLVTRGLAGRGVIANVEQQISQLNGQLARSDSDLAELQDQLAQISIERLKLNAKPREDAVQRLRELESNEVEYFQRRNTNKNALEKLQIKAPVSGVVYGLRVFKPGTVIAPGEQIMYIVPDDDGVIVRARIKSDDITEVYVGQEAELKFAAYTDRGIPFINGKVTTISADAFTDENTGLRYYEVDVEPEEATAEKLGANAPLTPGQPVNLFLNTGGKTFLDYLLKPLMDNLDRAFRE